MRRSLPEPRTNPDLAHLRARVGSVDHGRVDDHSIPGGLPSPSGEHGMRSPVSRRETLGSRMLVLNLLSAGPSSDEEHRTALHPRPLLLRRPDDRLRPWPHDTSHCRCWRWGLGRSSNTALLPGPLPLRRHDDRLRLWLRKTRGRRCGFGLGHIPSGSEPRRAALHPRPPLFSGRSLGERRRGRGRHGRRPRHRDHAQSAVAEDWQHILKRKMMITYC